MKTTCLSVSGHEILMAIIVIIVCNNSVCVYMKMPDIMHISKNIQQTMNMNKTKQWRLLNDGGECATYTLTLIVNYILCHTNML